MWCEEFDTFIQLKYVNVTLKPMKITKYGILYMASNIGLSFRIHFVKYSWIYMQQLLISWL